MHKHFKRSCNKSRRSSVFSRLHEEDQTLNSNVIISESYCICRGCSSSSSTSNI